MPFLSASEVQETIVTTQKQIQPPQDIGETINVGGARQLAYEGITGVADLANTAPHLFLAAIIDETPIYALWRDSFDSTSFGSARTVSVDFDELKPDAKSWSEDLLHAGASALVEQQ
jgi:hypothetical protein